MKPKLRFKEFTDDWEEKKFSKDTYIKARVGWKNLKAEEYVNKGIPMIAGKHIHLGKINWEDADFITEERYEESPEIALQNGDVIFSKDGTLGNPAYIENLHSKATINGTMMLIRLSEKNDGINSRFFYYILQSSSFLKLINIIKSGGTVPHIFQRDIINFRFYTPISLAEQEKIGKFFSLLDQRIEKQERKVALLEEEKKGYMQQIFNQELRFKDEEGNNYPDWKEKRIKDIVTFENNKRKPITESDRSKGKYPYYGATGIVDYVDDYLFDDVRLLVGEDGADWSAYANTAFIATGKYWVNNHAHVITTKVMNLYFLKYLFNFMELRKWVCGNAPAKLNLESIKSIYIQFPSLSEQEKIANFLSLLDQRIEKEQEKLHLLKEEKKSLLQQMFV